MLSSRRFPTTLVLCGVLSCAGLAHAANQPKEHFPTSEDLRHTKAVGGPQLSPDGKSVLFAVMDSTADGAKSHIWVVATAGGAETLRQLTFSPPADKRGERDAQWSPDGDAIFFLAHRGEHTQLFRLDMRGGEAAPYDLKVLPAVDESKAKDAIPPAKDEKSGDKKVEKDEPLPIDVAGYALSADGKWLAVWARDPQTPGEKKEQEEKADADWVNHDQHGTRLYVAALKPDGGLEGALKVTGVAPDVRNAVWSEASDKLLVTTEAMNDQSDLGPAGAAWVVDAAAPEKAEKVDAIPPTVGRAMWTPDESVIVFGAQTPEDAPPGYEDLFALPKGAAKPVRLSAGFDGQINAYALYFPHDGGVVAEAGMGTKLEPVKLTLDGSKAPQPVDLNAAVVTGLNTNHKQTGWVWLAESGGDPVKLCTAAKLGDSCTALPLPELAPKDLRNVAPELVHWKNGSFDVEGLLYLPPQAKHGRVPLIVDVHGGPFGAWENRNDLWAAFLVGHGWAVLRPNPRVRRTTA